MAKNVQIVPVSGSLNFQDPATGKEVKFDFASAGQLTIKSGSVNIVTIDSSSFDVADNASFILPVVAGNPPTPSVGQVWFDSSGKVLKLQGN